MTRVLDEYSDRLTVVLVQRDFETQELELREITNGTDIDKYLKKVHSKEELAEILPDVQTN